MATLEDTGMLVTPEQWRDQLLAALATRQTYLKRMDDYYCG